MRVALCLAQLQSIGSSRFLFKLREHSQILTSGACSFLVTSCLPLYHPSDRQHRTFLIKCARKAEVCFR